MRRLFATLACGAILSSLVAPVAAAARPVAPKTASYIVVVDSRDDIDAVSRDVRRAGGTVTSVYRYAVGGFAARLTARHVAALLRDPRVELVSPNKRVRKRVVAPAPQIDAQYQLDRIDQAALPLDDVYAPPATGEGVQIYMIDTGVRATHVELAGRVIHGADVVGVDNSGLPLVPADDCDGHGTHTAALAAGTTFGVAKKATIVAVRVLDCSGEGDEEGVVKGIDWVLKHHRSGTLAVANLSLGCDIIDECEDSRVMDIALVDLVRDGIVPVTAAGNRGRDACNVSPGHTPEALNVGATNQIDERLVSSLGTSSYGTCLDLFAPGVRILSAGISSDTAEGTQTGTSMASPLVAGYVAMIGQVDPTACPEAVHDAVIERATTDVVKNAGAGSPNAMLNVTNVSPVGRSAPGTPSALVSSPLADGIVVSWDPGCNGGATGGATSVRVFRDAEREPFRTLTVRGGSRVVVRDLSDRHTYRVSVRRRNANGVSDWSEKSVAMRPRSVVQGNVVSTSALASSTEAKVRGAWTVDATNEWNCRLLGTGGRIRFTTSGACAVSVVPRYTNVAFERTFRPMPGSAPRNSGSGRRLVYEADSRRLFAIDANNRVVRATTVVATVRRPVTGRYKLSRTTDGFVAKTGRRSLEFRGIVDEFTPVALGKALSDTATYLPPTDAAWFRNFVTRAKLLVIIS